LPRVTGRINHTTIVAYLALFVALGGSAYAAATITGRDVVDRSLTGADIRNGSVRSPDVRGITGGDLGAGDPWILRSPNKQFSVAVRDSGVRIQGPASSVLVSAGGVTIEGSATTEIRAGALMLNGGSLSLNGSCSPFADANKVFQHFHTETGGATGFGQGSFPGLSQTLRGC
jgi:hypothetical protein